nr:PREDICTED: mitochondrial antiviral-signaling protein [Opisthocomus hoazin]
MGFAEDKVYDYILKNLKNFKNIRVASLADSLSCLTDADRDELHSREETRGSQATVYRFYQHLKCWKGWVPDLINALRQNNAGHLADELQHVYDSCQARLQPPDSLQKTQAAPGPQHGEPPGSFVDVYSPLLVQQQFDAEQKRVEMQREHGGGGDAEMETTPVATPVSRGTSLSCDTSVKPPVQESKLPEGEMASSTLSMLTKEKGLPASADPLPTVAGSSEGTSGRTASRVSSATSIWASWSNVERDVELSKPGDLLSTPGESPELGAGNDLRHGAGPLGNSPDFDSGGGRGAATSSPQAKVPPGDRSGSSLPYIVPAVGIALISAVAFLVYARLQK